MYYIFFIDFFQLVRVRAYDLGFNMQYFQKDFFVRKADM